jgi:tetratricopeptide (TPR) repeat protein
MNRKQRRLAAKSKKKRKPTAVLDPDQTVVRDPDQVLAEAKRLHERGDFRKAADLYRDTMGDNPRRAEVLQMIGRDAVAQGQPAVGVALFEEAISIDAGSVDVHVDLALGLEADARIEDAVAAYARAIEQDPAHRIAWLNMAILARRLGRLEDAADAAGKALALDLDDPVVLGQLGGILVELDRAADAEPHFRRAAELRPEDASALNNLALALRAQGRLDEAVAACRGAIGLAPENAEAHVHLAELLLLRGDDDEEGFREYEWRRALPGAVVPGGDLEAPDWDGTDPNGRTILVIAEQGFGDTLQFCRYVPILTAQGARVVLVVQETLADLCRTLDGVDTVVASGASLPAFDLKVPLLSLPYFLGSDVGQAPYLTVSADRIAPGHEAIGGGVGIAWQGNPTGAGDRGRSVALTRFADLANIDGVRLVSLQKGFGHEQLTALADATIIEDAGSRCADFADTAAAMAGLDLIITTDTAVAHLAGALGCPAWVLLKHDPDWRWHLARADSPWYPSLRLFRQPTAGDWESVFAAVRSTLVDRFDGQG